VARILTGRRQVDVTVLGHARPADLASALAEVCPALVGQVILEDRSGLQQSYTLNLNGTSFVSDEQLELKSGDTVLLFSSQAGG
jgi:molybdopterin converting factor small subunit